MDNLTRIREKICTLEELLRRACVWRAAGERIVFTNGCFDLLHYGHICYLAQARDLGDHLVVGLNSTDSVRRLKGPRRPINDEATRAYALAAMQMVDAVIFFDEDTPLLLIEALLPEVLVKGGDWRPEQIVGSSIVLTNGGQVLSLPFVEGYSTTSIEQKIRTQAL
ncbi:MAG: D-glycero-beta-D-manno-heptose 1-phosphate adenylyltransferase [Saprospiraceae bacterium]|nr:D-glycero-beta-D-manno-heptose 1-phosphate adenylyltransferase [Saprospiraceae bacterium]MDW8485041.1 D-glycero-beta-D-manno-heptose 1-phosphate adenylyltransferase [Saprospiraceae bacterium]